MFFRHEKCHPNSFNVSQVTFSHCEMTKTITGIYNLESAIAAVPMTICHKILEEFMKCSKIHGKNYKSELYLTK